MSDNKDVLKRIATYEDQESRLQFDRFSNADALDVGMMIIEHAKKNDFAISIDITVNGYQVFSYGFDGTTINNRNWMRRKINTVNIVQKASLLVGAILERDNQDLSTDWHLDEKDHTHHGGAFPIRLRGTGVIGTICVSGRPQEQDHQIIVDVLEAYLGV